MDCRAQNEAVWQYSERLREVGAGPIQTFNLIDIRLFLECALGSEKEDVVPIVVPETIFEYCAVIGPLDRWLRERVMS